jgi:hypothetical protein
MTWPRWLRRVVRNRHRYAIEQASIQDKRAVNLISTQVESLLTLQLVDGIADDGNRGSTRQECIGQGLGNLASGLTGGQGGCALIGQSLINVEAGGTSRLSGMVMAGGLAAGLVSAAPLLGPCGNQPVRRVHPIILHYTGLAGSPSPRSSA